MLNGWYLMCGEDTEDIVEIHDLKCVESILPCQRQSIYTGNPRLRKVIDAAEQLNSEWPDWTDEPTRQLLLKACWCDSDAMYTFLKLDV